MVPVQNPLRDGSAQTEHGNKMAARQKRTTYGRVRWRMKLSGSAVVCVRRVRRRLGLNVLGASNANAHPMHQRSRPELEAVEGQANRFASAFLLPARPFFGEFPRGQAHMERKG